VKHRGPRLPNRPRAGSKRRASPVYP
jgi:hypothetical protein